MRRRIAARAAIGAAVLCALELTAREITRRSPIQLIAHAALPNGAILLIGLTCAIGAALLYGKTAPRAVTFAILTAAFIAGVAAQMRMGARLQSDGFYYYAYLRSIAFDRDVDFTNDYRMLGLGDKANLFTPTPTGHAQSAWTIGPAIVWSPFFAVGHAAASVLRARGVDVSTDGTSFPYRQAICIAGLFYGLLGCWFAYRFTRRQWPPALAAPAVALTIAGSFMLWYMVKEPTMTHAPSMASVAGFMWLWAASRERRTLGGWALLGAAAGLMSLIRWQNALFMLLPAIDVVQHAARPSTPRDRIEALVGGAVFLGCALVAFLPQMIAWKAIYGSYVARSPVGPAILWANPRLVDILFSARNGLFSTSPMLYLGAIGLVLLVFERPAIAVPAIVTIALMVYFNATIQDWWGSAAFGGRRFDGTIPLFCLGLAAFVDAGSRVVRRYPRPIVIATLGLAAIANIALMQAAQDGRVRIGETLPFDRAWSEQSHVMHGWFGNPFTYPASLVFALRNGVSPGDYDLLSTERFLADPSKPYGGVDIGGADEWLLDTGWHAAEREDGATYRWVQQRAALRVPLDHAAPLRVQVRLHAFAYPGAPAQTVTIAANGRACAPIPVPPAWQVVECTLDEGAWRSGVNELALTFGYAARPLDVGVGDDPRSLAAAIDWVRVSVTSADTAR